MLNKDDLVTSTKKDSKILLEWSSFPFNENFRKSLALIMFLIFFFLVLWFVAVISWEMPLFYLIGVLFIVIALLPYFIPTKYKLYQYRMEIYYLFVKVERHYSDFRSFYSDKNGVMLSTFIMPRWLDSFRGQSLRFSKDGKEKEELFKLLEEKVGNRR